MSYVIERYPTRWIDVWHLADGRRLTLRPVLLQDAELEQALVRALSPTSRYQRFFSPIRELPSGWLERLTQIDYRLQQAFIVETFVGDQPVAVAEARYVVDATGEQCEFAVVVADDWQHLGPGPPAAAKPDAQCSRCRRETHGRRRNGRQSRHVVAGAQPGLAGDAPSRRRCAGAPSSALAGACFRGGPAGRRGAYCTGPFSAAGMGSDMISMPSSSSARRSSGVAWPRMPRASISP